MGWRQTTNPVIAATAVIVASCTPLASSSSVPTPHPPASVGRTVPFTRSCDSAVFGEPNVRHAVTFGPLTLIGTDQRLAETAFDESHGRYDAIKVLAIVAGPDDVTVTVPLSKRDSVFLLYDPRADANRWGFRLAEADAQVTFDACARGEPQYNGGLLLTEPGCVELEIVTVGSALQTAAFPVGDRASCG